MFDKDFNFEDWFGMKQPTKRSGIKELDEAIDKVVSLNNEIQQKGN